MLQHLDRDLVALKSSPRGSADMLAATIFIDYVGRDEELNIGVVSPDRNRRDRVAQLREASGGPLHKARADFS
jgi:hypothetical protein